MATDVAIATDVDVPSCSADIACCSLLALLPHGIQAAQPGAVRTHTQTHTQPNSYDENHTAVARPSVRK